MKEEKRGDERGEKRHVKMKEKVKEKRREDREKKRREKKEKIFFQKNVSIPSNPPDESTQMFRKKIPVGRIIPPFFCKSSESDRFFIYLHASNSIFRVRGINAEWVSGGTVLTKGNFTRDEWNNLLHLFNISHQSSLCFAKKKIRLD